MALVETDNDFEKIVQLNVKRELADAFISLGYSTRDLGVDYRKEIFETKANQLKTDINAYIDSLVESMSK